MRTKGKFRKIMLQLHVIVSQMDPLVFFAMTMQNVIVLKVTMETSAKTNVIVIQKVQDIATRKMANVFVR